MKDTSWGYVVRSPNKDPLVGASSGPQSLAKMRRWLIQFDKYRQMDNQAMVVEWIMKYLEKSHSKSPNSLKVKEILNYPVNNK